MFNWLGFVGALSAMQKPVSIQPQNACASAFEARCASLTAHVRNRLLQLELFELNKSRVKNRAALCAKAREWLCAREMDSVVERAKATGQLYAICVVELMAVRRRVLGKLAELEGGE